MEYQNTMSTNKKTESTNKKTESTNKKVESTNKKTESTNKKSRSYDNVLYWKNKSLYNNKISCWGAGQNGEIWSSDI